MNLMNIKAGETCRIKFHGLGNAGYVWDYFVEKGAGLIEVVREDQASPAPPPDTSRAMPTTYEAEIVYALTAMEPGSADIVFFLHRVWETDKLPLKENRYHIEITA